MVPQNQNEIPWVKCQMVGHFGTIPLPLSTKEENKANDQLEGVVGPLRIADLDWDQPPAEVGSRMEVTSMGAFLRKGALTSPWSLTYAQLGTHTHTHAQGITLICGALSMCQAHTKHSNYIFSLNPHNRSTKYSLSSVGWIWKGGVTRPISWLG